MAPNHSKIVNKCRDGGHLSDAEVLEGAKHFRRVADMLVTCGPVFELAFKEANAIAMRLNNFAEARGLNRK